MKKNLALVFLVWLFFGFSMVFCPQGGAEETAALKVDARSAILLEVSSGTTLFEQNADESIEPASFTKVLTLYLVFDSLKQGLVNLNDEIWVSERAWRTGGSKMFIGVDTKVPLEELLKGIAVVSGNDACTAVAEHLYGSVEGFVNAMNRKAQELGMNNSHFENPHGLPAEGQVTTARDMATLAVKYLQRFPESLRFHSMQEYTYNDISQHNRNRLLRKDPSVDGLKTGFVAAAGYHLTATSRREGMRLIAVVMGAKTPGVREREALKLLNYGFRHYLLVQPFVQDQPVTSVKVWKGVTDVLNLYAAEAATLLIPQTEKKSLRWEVEAPREVTAPIESQQEFGKVVFYLGDEVKKNVALVSHDAIGQAGWPKRVWHSMLRLNQLEVNWPWFGGVAGGVFLLLVVLIFVANRRSSRRSRSSFGR